MIAQYTYGPKTEPKMMALLPNDINVKHPNHNSLLMHELLFTQNRFEIQVPGFVTKTTKPSTGQYQGIDDLIDAMDLEACGTFKRFHDPTLQFLYQAIENRALNPQNPLIETDDEILERLHTSRHQQEQVKPFLENMKKLFELEVMKTERQTRKVTKIGTATPAEDFTKLLSRGEPLQTLVPQIQNAIDKIAFQSIEIPEIKIVKALQVYRENASKLKKPFLYNEWIGNFKKELIDRGKIGEWQRLIVAERYGLITTVESEVSTITNSDAEEFYRVEDDANIADVADDGSFDDV